MEELKQYQIGQKQIKKKLEVQKILFEKRKIPVLTTNPVAQTNIDLEVKEELKEETVVKGHYNLNQH